MHNKEEEMLGLINTINNIEIMKILMIKMLRKRRKLNLMKFRKIKDSKTIDKTQIKTDMDIIPIRISKILIINSINQTMAMDTLQI